MFRILQSWRVRRGAKTARQSVAHDGEQIFFETWAGSWVEQARAGRAIVGVLRDADLKPDEIRAILKEALEEVDAGGEDDK